MDPTLGMTDAFDFMFGFYGLLLGLAVAEIAAGFSRACCAAPRPSWSPARPSP